MRVMSSPAKNKMNAGEHTGSEVNSRAPFEFRVSVKKNVFLFAAKARSDGEVLLVRVIKNGTKRLRFLVHPVRNLDGSLCSS